MTSKLKSGAMKVFSREGFLKIFSHIGKHLPKIEKSSVIFISSLTTIIVLAVLIRILPLKWGFNLSEFDPYFQYDVTKYIAKNGFFSWHDWHIENMWFPQGRDVAYTSFPGLPMTGAALYFLISSFGFSVEVLDVCIIFPVVFAAITCIVAYYLGKEIGGSKVGLLSAFFLAVNPAYIGRTSLGFYDDETVGIFGILITFLLYIRSLKQDEKWHTQLAYSIASGVSLGYVCASWGASRYLLSVLALFTFILLIAKMYSRRLLISYSTLITVGLSIAILVPKLGLSFIREFETVAAIGILLLLVVYELSQLFSEQKRKIFIALTLTSLGILAITLWQIGFISLPIAKFISVINPFERITMPLVESVQEHRPATWASFYYQFGILVFMAPLAVVFALRRITYQKIFIITYAITSLYFSASMIRLTILVAPSLCVLGALTIVEIIRPFVDIATQRVFSRRRLRFLPRARIGKTFSVVLIITLFVLTFLPLGRQIDSAYSPTTIGSSSLPMRAEINDWINTLVWMRENLPPDTIVASWWDYGYWITVMGDQISLADNGTFNGTQIAWMGRMFMSTEEDAITMMEDFNKYSRTRYNLDNNISYVVVFTTIGLASNGRFLFGDEVKWRWMAKIGWNSTADKPLEDFSITTTLADYWSQQNPSLQGWYEEFGQTVALPKADRVLTKMMIYGTFQLESVKPEHFQLVYASEPFGLVYVYKVLY